MLAGIGNLFAALEFQGDENPMRSLLLQAESEIKADGVFGFSTKPEIRHELMRVHI